MADEELLISVICTDRQRHRRVMIDRFRYAQVFDPTSNPFSDEFDLAEVALAETLDEATSVRVWQSEGPGAIHALGRQTISPTSAFAPDPDGFSGRSMSSYRFHCKLCDRDTRIDADKLSEALTKLTSVGQSELDLSLLPF